MTEGSGRRGKEWGRAGWTNTIHDQERKSRPRSLRQTTNAGTTTTTYSPIQLGGRKSHYNVDLRASPSRVSFNTHKDILNRVKPGDEISKPRHQPYSIGTPDICRHARADYVKKLIAMLHWTQEASYQEGLRHVQNAQLALSSLATARIIRSGAVAIDVHDEDRKMEAEAREHHEYGFDQVFARLAVCDMLHKITWILKRDFY